MPRMLLWFPVVYCLHFIPTAILSFLCSPRSSKVQPARSLGKNLGKGKEEGGGKNQTKIEKPTTPNSSSLSSIHHFYRSRNKIFQQLKEPAPKVERISSRKRQLIKHNLSVKFKKGRHGINKKITGLQSLEKLDY